MEAILVSTDRLLQVARDSHAQAGALGRLWRVLDGAMACCVSDATFADWLKVALENLLGMVDTLDNFTRTVDNLTARLQATCHPKGHHKGSRRRVSPAGQLAGLHGNDLFRTLMTLQLPASAPAEFFLEVALAAQSLIVHDQLDLFIELSEKIILEGNPMAIYEYNFMAFMYHRKTLDKFVQEHIDLANAAAISRPPTGPTK
ncbi:uncharacterized protein [Triticum aestivum]|uniref:uncharacterized protein n=1 Tax=Triticum aestivum TaxID=4565 RepID=UPI001ABCE4CB|nr:uncharacterized protein LOC120964063 [Aegilops tauschii subsp. strangulata]XP_044401794.1 uncharacterized protein LOC123125342 [Triticum aestivum]